MSRVMISYWHKQLDLAKRLHTSLSPERPAHSVSTPISFLLSLVAAAMATEGVRPPVAIGDPKLPKPPRLTSAR